MKGPEGQVVNRAEKPDRDSGEEEKDGNEANPQTNFFLKINKFYHC